MNIKKLNEDLRELVRHYTLNENDTDEFLSTYKQVDKLMSGLFTEDEFYVGKKGRKWDLIEIESGTYPEVTASFKTRSEAIRYLFDDLKTDSELFSNHYTDYIDVDDSELENLLDDYQEQIGSDEDDEEDDEEDDDEEKTTSRAGNPSGEYTYAMAEAEGKIIIDSKGNIDCSRLGLTSLEGAPKEVGGNFKCRGNELTSLQGAPEVVKGHLDCAHNHLTSLEGAPQTVSGDFDCSWNSLTSLEGGPKEVGWGFYCYRNNLNSLEGAPEKVGGRFDCGNNKLDSLEGAPREVGWSFDCSDNTLDSLEGAPQKVGHFVCIFNPTKFTKEEVRAVCEVGGYIQL